MVLKIIFFIKSHKLVFIGNTTAFLIIKLKILQKKLNIFLNFSLIHSNFVKNLL